MAPANQLSLVWRLAELMSNAQRTRMRTACFRVRPQTVLHKDDVVQRRDDGKNKGGAQHRSARNPHPALRMHLQQHNEENRADLRNRVGFSENARTEIAESGNREEHSAGCED